MIEYDFAYKVLEKTINNEIPNAQTRDFIFKDVLNSFSKEPVNVFQVGAIETFDVRWRVGSGWSDIIFGEYINTNGGTLTIVDINLNNLAHSAYAASKLEYKVNLIYGDAIDYISNKVDDISYDVFYLDGGNDPLETLNQFLKIKRGVVIIDDFKIKGTLTQKYLKNKNINFKKYDVANEVGVVHLV